MNKPQSVLLISPEPWSHIFVSKHHYAIELSRRGYNIYFLNPPNPLQFKNTTLQKLSDQSGITLIDYPGQIRGLRLLPSFIRLSFNRAFLRKLESLIKGKIDIVWNFENSRFFDLHFAGRRLKIYHQVDLNQTFNLRQAAMSADICFCTTDLIRNQISPFNNNVFKIHHGTSNEALQFQYSFKEKPTEPIKAVYIGNLDMPFMDRQLLKNLVSSFPEVQFRLIGPYCSNGETYQLLKQFQNVKWLGRQSASRIPSYLDDADVLLVLYAEKYHKDQASPHKFMEYFASGRIIVSTYTDEYKDKRDLLVMSNDNDNKGCLVLFKKVIDNIKEYNSAYLMQKRRAFAADNTYEKQLERINEKLKDICAINLF